MKALFTLCLMLLIAPLVVTAQDSAAPAPDTLYEWPDQQVSFLYPASWEVSPGYNADIVSVGDPRAMDYSVGISLDNTGFTQEVADRCADLMTFTTAQGYEAFVCHTDFDGYHDFTYGIFYSSDRLETVQISIYVPADKVDYFKGLADAIIDTVSAGGSTPAPVAVAEVTIGDYIPFTTPQGKLAFNYPSNWFIFEVINDQTVRLSSVENLDFYNPPSDFAYIDIYKTTLDPETIEGNFEVAAGSRSEGGPVLTIETEEGLTGFERRYISPVSTDEILLFWAVLSGGDVVSIQLTTPENRLETYEPVARHMLNTLVAASQQSTGLVFAPTTASEATLAEFDTTTLLSGSGLALQHPSSWTVFTEAGNGASSTTGHVLLVSNTGILPPEVTDLYSYFLWQNASTDFDPADATGVTIDLIGRLNEDYPFAQSGTAELLDLNGKKATLETQEASLFLVLQWSDDLYLEFTVADIGLPIEEARDLLIGAASSVTESQLMELPVAPETVPYLSIVDGYRNLSNEYSFSADLAYFATIQRTMGVVQVYQLATGQVVKDIDTRNQYEEIVKAVQLSEDGQKLVMMAEKNWIIRDLQTDEEYKLPLPLLREQPAVAFSPDLQLAAYQLLDKSVDVINLADGSRYDLLNFDASFGTLVSFSPDGRYLMVTAAPTASVTSSEQHVLIWDVEAQSVIFQDTIEGFIRNAAFSPDNQYLVMSSFADIYIWDFQKNALQRVNNIVGRSTLVASPQSPFVFTPDGKAFFFGGANASINRFDLMSGTVTSVIEEAHDNVIATLGLNASGTVLVSIRSNEYPEMTVGVERDVFIRFWDVKTGTLLREFTLEGFGTYGEGYRVVFGDSDRGMMVIQREASNEFWVTKLGIPLETEVEGFVPPPIIEVDSA